MRISVLGPLVICSLIVFVAAWTKEDHEIFRLRDEVAASEGTDITFYDLLGITPTASQEDINKAYRRKSRSIHPDKVKQSFIASKSKPAKSKPGSKKKPGVHMSKGPSQREIQQAVKQAGERFARLGIVTNILRGERRERYDHFLKNGFPRWRGTGYYYARFRPGLGSVLLGLFIVGGGAAHYGALILGWKRQREFVDRYIRHARRAAWGDEMGIRGIPGMDSMSGTNAPAPPVEAGDGSVSLNRRQKRMYEKESKREKDGKKASRASGTETPTENGNIGPTGEKKRVIAENGKVLIVDSIGNVFLEEETEDGEKQEFLLDVDEIPRPTYRDTALFRLPIWLFDRSAGRLMRKPSPETESKSEDTADEDGYEVIENGVERVDAPANGKAKKRNKRR